MRLFRLSASTTRNTLLSLVTLTLSWNMSAAQVPRVAQDFDTGWRFTWGDPALAQQPDFDDRSWTAVALPHDASIAGPVAQSNPSGPAGGFFPTGVVWYRKSFTLSRDQVQREQVQRRAYIVFEGVMANSEVWINGVHLGHRPNGYVSFYYELGAHLQAGSNVIAVRCDTSRQPASRWYEGLGIYRPVHLVRMGAVHVEPWSTFVTTPEIAADQAKVHVQVDIDNDSSAAKTVSLQVMLTSPDGQTAAQETTPPMRIEANRSGQFLVPMRVRSPQVWDLSHPALYQATVRVRTGGSKQPVDEEVQPFGIREFHFDAATGFWLNGRNFKIKGAAVHIDGGALGIAVPTAVWERRLTALRALGVNAIRTAHNPPSPEFLDLCDRMGFLVMDEMFDCWEVGKNPFDYHLDFDQWSLTDTRDTVRRDRNHPSIILWSAGNEIHDTPKVEQAKRILASLVDTFHRNDPTRPVTQALFRPNVSHDYDDGLADMLDVIGQNYREQEILAAHAAKPTRKILGTENTHDRNQWVAMRDHPEYSGQFLWTGVDYLGEAGQWPLIGAPFGLIDRDAFPEARGYERQSWWADAPNVHMARRVAPDDATAVDPGYEAVPPRFQQTLFLDWTPRNPKLHEETVEVYTNAEEVELWLNGASLGRKTQHADASPLVWKVAFAAGSLKAVAYSHGAAVTQDELHTAGTPQRIRLTAERSALSPDAQDVAYVAAEVVDGQGNVVPNASNAIHFELAGPAAIAAVDNGSDADHGPFQATQRNAFEGRAVVILRATAVSGAIRVTARADGLESGSASLSAVPAKPRLRTPPL